MSQLLPPPPALLRKLRAHETWLHSNTENGRQLKVVGLELEGINLDGYDLSVCEIDSEWIRNSSLRNTWFIGSFLWRVKFSGSDLTGARFDRAELFETSFIEAKYPGARFEGANIEKAFWTTAEAQAACADYETRLVVFNATAQHRTKMERQSESRLLQEEMRQWTIRHQARVRTNLALWRSVKFADHPCLHHRLSEKSCLMENLELSQVYYL